MTGVQTCALPISIFLRILTFLPRNRRIFPRILTFSRENPTKSANFSASFDFFPRKSREIGRFFREFAPENPAKLCGFFPRNIRSPEERKEIENEPRIKSLHLKFSLLTCNIHVDTEDCYFPIVIWDLLSH